MFINKIIIRGISFSVTLIFFVFFGLKNSQAIEYEMLGGRPANPDANVPNSSSWFIYNLKPGEAKEDAVEVMNLFSQEWEALIYAADTTQSSSGGFALHQFSEAKKEVGSWVKFYPDSPPEIFENVFKEKEKKIIPFCAMSREDVDASLNEKVKFKINWKIISDEDFSVFQKWCQGVDSVQKKLGPQERVKVPFVIKVPENIDTGEHTGGILIERMAHDTSDVSGSAVNLVTRVGVRIYETVPGEVIKKLSLDNLEIIKNFKEFDYNSWFSKNKKPEEYLVQMKIRNDGNASVMHENIIHIKDLIFRKKNEDISRNFQVLKKDTFISNYSWKSPRLGYFSFVTEIKYKNASGEDVVLNSDPIKIWIIPWREMAVVIPMVLLIFGCWWGWKKHQKKKYGGIGWVEYEIKEGETIVNLANDCNIDWKILAKTNKLKAPYILQIGQIILVPPGKKELLRIKPKTKIIKVKKTDSAVIDISDKKLREILDIYEKTKKKNNPR